LYCPAINAGFPLTFLNAPDKDHFMRTLMPGRSSGGNPFYRLNALLRAFMNVYIIAPHRSDGLRLGERLISVTVVFASIFALSQEMGGAVRHFPVWRISQ
jgi:hypothetical protein